MNRNALLTRRIREIRADLYGEYGAEALANALEIPVQSWMNFEQGVSMPADVMLAFLDLTNTDPHWLRTGEGERVSARSV